MFRVKPLRAHTAVELWVCFTSEVFFPPVSPCIRWYGTETISGTWRGQGKAISVLGNYQSLIHFMWGILYAIAL